jgi:nucleotide-binding universal stress UspA family protein
MTAGGNVLRAYLVVMDETEEAAAALRYASLRAAATGCAVRILALVPRQDFTAFGGVQATIEQEARERAEVMANNAAGSLLDEGGRMPKIAVRTGDPTTAIKTYLAENANIAALVLAAAGEGAPGPLVSHFASVAGSLPCPLTIIPPLTAEQLEQLSGSAREPG